MTRLVLVEGGLWHEHDDKNSKKTIRQQSLAANGDAVRQGLTTITTRATNAVVGAGETMQHDSHR